MNNFEKKILLKFIQFFSRVKVFQFFWVFTAFFTFKNYFYDWTIFCTILTDPQQSARKSAENDPLSRQNPDLSVTFKSSSQRGGMMPVAGQGTPAYRMLKMVKKGQNEGKKW